MQKRLDLLSGLGLGAAIAYLFDKDTGGRHRALVRDKAVRLLHESERGVNIASRDLAHRTKGFMAEGAARLRRDSADDEVLIERIRSKIGRIVSHPSALEISVRDGLAIVSGQILRAEVEPLLACISRVRGIREVENRLEPHRHAEGISSLQGGRKKYGEPIDLFQSHWSPSTRLIAGVVGIGAISAGIRARGPLGLVIGLAGLATLLRSATDMEFGRMAGLSGRDGIRLHKTVVLPATRQEVYDFWTHPERFPQFMRDLLDVRISNERTHWSIHGPLGAPVSWDAEITRSIPDQMIAWRSVPGSMIRHSGRVRFFDEEGGTKVEIDFSYNPPAGLVGHTLALLTGSNPKRRLDEAMMQLKTQFTPQPAFFRGRSMSL